MTVAPISHTYHIVSMASEDQERAASESAEMENKQQTAKEVVHTFLDETTVHGLPQLHRKHGEIYCGMGYL